MNDQLNTFVFRADLEKKNGRQKCSAGRSFISKYFLQNPYFTYFLCTLYIGYDIQRYQTKKKRVCLSKFGSRWVKPAHIFWMEIPTVNFEHCLWHEILLQVRILISIRLITWPIKSKFHPWICGWPTNYPAGFWFRFYDWSANIAFDTRYPCRLDFL